MRKCFFALVWTALTMQAATLTTTAQCGSTIVTGNGFASCGIPFTPGSAQAMAGFFEASADALGQLTSASATFDDEDVLTVTGGVGNGLFVPCMTATGVDAIIKFGSLPLFGSRAGERSCPLAPSGFLPFTFGVPQTFELSAFARVEGEIGLEEASASFDGPILFFDTAKNPLPGANFTLVPAPEPATWLAPAALLLIGLLGRARSVSCAARRSS